MVLQALRITNSILFRGIQRLNELSSPLSFLFQLFASLLVLQLKTLKIRLEAFIQLCHQFDVVFLLLYCFLHELDLLSGFLLVLVELGLHTALHFFELSAHLLFDALVLIALLDQLSLQLGNHVTLCQFLFLCDRDVRDISFRRFLKLLFFNQDFCRLDLELQIFLFESALSGNQLFKLIRVQLLHVFDLDQGLVSCHNMSLDLSQEDFDLTNLRTLEERLCQFVLSVGLVGSLQRFEDLVVTFFVHFDICVVNLIRVFSDGDLPHDFYFLDDFRDFWVFNNCLHLFVV